MLDYVEGVEGVSVEGCVKSLGCPEPNDATI